ncbi:unnamed protein product [Ranitomeya imitator]|uniref:Bacterial type II secretion system protein E domain-containing protein n=1 Tax=Ranitomeya imitator TaxID=111125 RepID=A0ABN9MDR3_9NEOB|nr:unnamed protein product [Ranitomeya imitator]
MDYESGTFKLHFAYRPYPAATGKKVVLRLLQQTSQPLDINALGMKSADTEKFHQALTSPQRHDLSNRAYGKW